MKALPISGRTALSGLILLSVRDLMRLLGVRRTTLWKLRRQPDFPKPVNVSHNLSWRAVDIQRWLEQRLAQTGGPAAQQSPAAPLAKEERVMNYTDRPTAGQREDCARDSAALLAISELTVKAQAASDEGVRQ